MADYDWPAYGMAPNAVTFYLQHNTAIHESPFTRQQQVLGRSAPRWICRLSLNGLESGRAADIDAMLAMLRGPQKTVTLFDWRRRKGRGVLARHSDYAPTVAETFFDDDTDFDDGEGFVVTPVATASKAASAGANQVTFEGVWPGTYPRKAGDYIGLGDGRPHIVTIAPPADGEGNVTLTFEPPLRSATAANAHVFEDVRGTFRLLTDDSGQNPTDVNGLSVYELDFVEVLP